MAYEPIIDRVVQIEPDGTVIRFIKANIDSTDPKPMFGIAVGSNVFERDTGKVYYFTNKKRWVVPDDVSGEIIEEEVVKVADKWLEDNISQETGYVLDRTLQLENAAAPADLVGNLNRFVTPEIYGAKGDGIEDDTLAFQNAANYAAAHNMQLIAVGNYKTTNTIILTCDAAVYGNIIYTLSDGIAVQIGDGQNLLVRKKIFLNVGATTIPNEATGVKVINVHNCLITFDYIRGFYNGVVIYSNGRGTAYNQFRINYIYNFKYGLTLATEGNGWVNENQFYGGRIISYWQYGSEGVAIRIIPLSVDTTGRSSSNKFYSPCLETCYTGIIIENGTRNEFYDVRIESVTNTFIAGNKAYMNMVYCLGGDGVQVSSESYNIIKSYRQRLLDNSILLSDTGRLTGKCAGSIINSKNYASAPKIGLLRLSDGFIPQIRGCTIDNDYNLNISSNSCCGFYVDTKYEKHFILRKESSISLQIAVIQLDDAGNTIENDPPIYDTNNYSFTLQSAFGDLDCKAYTTSVQSGDFTCITLSENCSSAFIGVRATSTGILYRLSLYAASRNTFVIDNRESTIFPIIPTSIGKNGQIVMNSNPSSSAIGWIYFNGVWNSIPTI